MRALLALLFLATIAKAETLGNVLAANKVPTSGFSAAELQQPDTQFAISIHPSPFLLAYRLRDDQHNLLDVFTVVRFDRPTNKLLRARFPSGDTNDFCTGNDLESIEDTGDIIMVSTHINPSAGCEILFNPDLTFHDELYGWNMGSLDGKIIYSPSMVHFAAIHAGGLALYDPRTKKSTPIYPLANDPNRRQFSAQLKQHLPTPTYCRANNLPCDPSDFNADPDRVTMNPSIHSFTFTVTLSPEGFGPRAESSVHPRTDNYICNLQPTFRCHSIATAPPWSPINHLP
jgi:hypothetical protein